MKIIIDITINDQYLSACNNTVFISYSAFAEYVFIFAQTSPPPLKSLFAKQPVLSVFEIIAFINRKRTKIL